MTKEAPFERSDLWRNLDNADDPRSFVPFLDQAAANLREARLEVIRLLELNPGCSVLDVGSGAGEFLIEVARSVDSIRAVGVDSSDLMVKTATSRAQAEGVEVQFALGD